MLQSAPASQKDIQWDGSWHSLLKENFVFLAENKHVEF